MITFERTNEGYIFDNTILFGSTGHADVTLRLRKGDIMRYGKENEYVIDFPGEYDIGNISVFCVEANNLLHYLITKGEDRFALLQDSAALDMFQGDNVHVRYCTDGLIGTEIDRLEYTGQVQIL